MSKADLSLKDLHKQVIINIIVVTRQKKLFVSSSQPTSL